MKHPRATPLSDEHCRLLPIVGLDSTVIAVNESTLSSARDIVGGSVMQHIRGHLGRHFTLLTIYRGRIRSTSTLVTSTNQHVWVTRLLGLVLIIRLRLVLVA